MKLLFQYENLDVRRTFLDKVNLKNGPLLEKGSVLSSFYTFFAPFYDAIPPLQKKKAEKLQTRLDHHMWFFSWFFIFFS